MNSYHVANAGAVHARIRHDASVAKSAMRKSQARQSSNHPIAKSLQAAHRRIPTPPNPTIHLTNIQKLSLVAGVTTTPFGLAATLTAIESAKSYSWTTQTISSLLGGPEGLLLSASLVTSGLLASSFTYGYRESQPPSRIYDASAAGFAVSSALLSAAGVVHPPSEWHQLLAGGYFIGAPVMMGVMGGDMIAKGSKAAGALTLAAASGAMASVAAGLMQKYGLTGAYEFAASTFIGTWIFVSSAYALAANRLMNTAPKQSNK